MHRAGLIPLLIISTLLAGCVASPFEKQGRDIGTLTPSEALRQPEAEGATVLWGGRVVGVINAGEQTELEVLALPLRMGDMPDRDAEGGARFVIRHDGFLEPMNFAPGRYVTAMGRFIGVEERSVGAFPLRHPVVESMQLELWPVDPNSNRPNINFGVGVRF